MLTDRQKLILGAIVNDYIRSAEPVGSRSISKRGDIGYSAATIRNEMSDLEELGFLEQPHTSAGRIPSNQGYRYYVDHLLEIGELSPNDLNFMKGFFATKMREIEDVFEKVTSILSSMTNYTAITLGHDVFNTTLRHMQILPLNEHSAVAIIVTNTGHVENKVVSIPPDLPAHEIEKLVEILNTKLVGVPLLHLKAKLMTEVGGELRKYATRYTQLMQIVESAFHTEETDRIFLSGATNIMAQPEFKDVNKVKSILDLLDETPTMVKLISDSGPGIQVRIGNENILEAINNCSLITATYSLDGQPLGTIGILGPTRMEYGKVIGLLNYLSRDINAMLRNWV